MPEHTMRRFLLYSIALFLATNGIACLCPSYAAQNDDSTSHELHHGEIAAAISIDCCESCEEMASIGSQDLPVAIDLRFDQDDVEDDRVAYSIAIDPGPNPGDPPDDWLDQQERLTEPSPITLKDEMRD